MSEVPASEELADLMFAALDHGIESVREGGPLVQFTLVEAGGETGRSLERFVAGTLEDSVDAARNHLREGGVAERAAIAYDGYVTVEGERSDAIFVEGQEKGQPACVVFAQRYRPGGRLRKFTTIGNAAFVGEGDPLF